MHLMDDRETRADGGGHAGAGVMHKRQATLEDGRYLIYYTFGDKAGRATNAGAGGESRPEPDAATEAAEERSV